MPKTQSALLEAMAEQQVTVDGVTRPPARTRSSCSRPRTRSSTRGRSRFPRRSSTASSSRPRSAIRARRTSSASSTSSATGTRSPRSARSISIGELAELRRAVESRVRRPAPGALDRRPRARDEGGSTASRSAPRCAGSLSLERAARAWALLAGAGVRRPPRTSSACSGSVLVHLHRLRSDVLAEAREARAGKTAIREFVRKSASRVAPRPAPAGGRGSSSRSAPRRGLSTVSAGDWSVPVDPAPQWWSAGLFLRRECAAGAAVWAMTSPGRVPTVPETTWTPSTGPPRQSSLPHARGTSSSFV